MARTIDALKPLWDRYCNVSTETSARRSLWFNAWASISVYSVLALFYKYCVDSPAGFAVQNVVLLTGLGILVASYWSIVTIVRCYPKLSGAKLVVLGVVASIIATVVPNFHSGDIYTYISYGWQQAHYHVNPYTTVSWEILGYDKDRMLAKVWYDNVLTYGFAFGQIVRTVCQIGNGNLQLTFVLFKLLNWGVYAALAITLFAGAKKLKLERPELTLHLFLWSPLVLLQTLTNAHNDLIMCFVAVLGLLAAGSGSFVLAMPALVTAGLIKYVWFVSVPFLAIYAFYKRGWKVAAASLIAGGAAFYAWANPYIWEWRNFHWDVISISLSQDRSSILATMRSLGVLVHKAFYHQKESWIITATHNAMICTKFVILTAFLIYVSKLLLDSIRNRSFLTFSKLIEISVLSIALWICVVNPKFYCWYLLMVFPAALWLPERNTVRRLILLLSCTHLLGLSFIGQSHILDFLLLTAIPVAVFAISNARKSKRPTTSSEPTSTIQSREAVSVN